MYYLSVFVGQPSTDKTLMSTQLRVSQAALQVSIGPYSCLETLLGKNVSKLNQVTGRIHFLDFFKATRKTRLHFREAAVSLLDFHLSKSD